MKNPPAFVGDENLKKCSFIFFSVIVIVLLLANNLTKTTISLNECLNKIVTYHHEEVNGFFAKNDSKRLINKTVFLDDKEIKIVNNYETDKNILIFFSFEKLNNAERIEQYEILKAQITDCWGEPKLFFLDNYLFKYERCGWQKELKTGSLVDIFLEISTDSISGEYYVQIIANYNN